MIISVIENKNFDEYEVLEKEIITNAYAGNDVKHIASAKQVIVKALQQLEAEYGIKPQGNDVDHTI